MASIRERKNRDGTTAFHVQVRLKGYPAQTASFKRLTDAKRWAQRTKADLREGRYFPTHKAKRHTMADLIDRYLITVFPQKQPSSIVVQRPQLRWWREHIGHLRL